MLEMVPEYSQTLTNLAEVTMEERMTTFDTFWSEYSKFLSEDVGLTVDDRGQTSVTNVAKAISVSDCLKQMHAQCPLDCPIPSHVWLRLSFCPKYLEHILLSITQSVKYKVHDPTEAVLKRT